MNVIMNCAGFMVESGFFYIPIKYQQVKKAQYKDLENHIAEHKIFTCAILKIS